MKVLAVGVGDIQQKAGIFITDLELSLQWKSALPVDAIH